MTGDPSFIYLFQITARSIIMMHFDKKMLSIFEN